MKEAVASVWQDLEREGQRRVFPAERLYRALGADAIGIRASYLPGQNILELLIEVPRGWAGDSVIPQWRGMGHEVLNLELPPRKEARHLRLFLVSAEHRKVFLMVCEDLVAAIEGITDASFRVREIEICLLRWKLFFEKHGQEGLSIEMQQGLFAELMWLKRLLDADADPLKAVMAWKGCTRGYHDFEYNGKVVEVKSSRTKEPRNVTVNNERQLDDTGLRSLHLYVLSVHMVDNGGMTLPELTGSVKAGLTGAPSALTEFRNKLVNAGYLDIDADRYTTQLIIKSEDFYQVIEGFPRITSVPLGVGDLRYKVFLSACESFRVDLKDYLAELTEP